MNIPHKTLTILVALALSASLASAANITWGGPQQITGIGDVSTNGTLVGAFNVGATGVPSTVVNGVNFQSFSTVNGNGSFGNFTTVGSGFITQTNTDGGSPNAPFSTLPAAYQTLLASYSSPFAGTIAMTISGLVVGAQYEFQVWSNRSDGQFGGDLTVTSGNTTTLRGNTAGAAGGLGQWVIGSFTADALTQTITFAGDGDYGSLNAFQLRNITQTPSGVPDTGSTLALLGVTLAALCAAHRKLGVTARARR
jgi:hypothetical protein